MVMNDESNRAAARVVSRCGAGRIAERVCMSDQDGVKMGRREGDRERWATRRASRGGAETVSVKELGRGGRGLRGSVCGVCGDARQSEFKTKLDRHC
jgi:hypothetical protein